MFLEEKMCAKQEKADFTDLSNKKALQKILQGSNLLYKLSKAYYKNRSLYHQQE